MNVKLSQGISFNEQDAVLLQRDECDIYDYGAAVACGAIAGLIDVFLVGAPNQGNVLGKWTDEQADNFVMWFAKQSGWPPKEEKKNSVASAIGYLEQTYKVNYDQRHSGDVDNLFKMSLKNHHLKSLAHSPDIIGLFCSILGQFTSTAAFVSDGKLITTKTDSFELQGSNLISKLFCGLANWFGHIVSDMAGSSGGRGQGNGRGSGIPIPFYELFQFCNFGKFQVGNARQDFATIAVRAFQEGYDARHGAAMSIPVLLTELLIRFFWALRRYFYHHLPIENCIPSRKHNSLRLMILLGHGTLCAIDGIDAKFKSGGNFLLFFKRLNGPAWLRFIWLVFAEVFYRIGLNADIREYTASLRKINAKISNYSTAFEKIDINKFREESNSFMFALENDNEMELNESLLGIYKRLDMEIPWDGDFDAFMQNKNNCLQFKQNK